MSVLLGAGLEDKRVLVAGAAGGIGTAVATMFAEVGARVAAHDLHQEQVDSLVGGLPGDGHLALAADLRKPTAAQALIEQVHDIHVLVNVAAVAVRRNEVGEVNQEEFDFQQEINLRGAFFLSREAAEAMRRRGDGGRIINFSSQGWWTGGFGGTVVYSATKGGVVSMTRGMARTYAAHGVLFNCIAPGAVDTPMLTTGLSEEAYRSFMAQIPLGRIAQPRELAAVALFLASDHASYITGATVNVSGGQLMY